VPHLTGGEKEGNKVWKERVNNNWKIKQYNVSRKIWEQGECEHDWER